MRDIMERVLGEEEKAAKKIEEARARTAALRSRADEEADAILAQARTQAAALAKSRIESARASALEFAVRDAAQEEKRNQGHYEDAHSKIPALAAEIASLILATEIRRD